MARFLFCGHASARATVGRRGRGGDVDNTGPIRAAPRAILLVGGLVAEGQRQAVPAAVVADGIKPPLLCRNVVIRTLAGVRAQRRQECGPAASS
jgi:hypothetical protein